MPSALQKLEKKEKRKKKKNRERVMTVLQMHKGISQQIFARGARPRLAPRGRERFPMRGSNGSARRAARTRRREEGSLLLLPELDVLGVCVAGSSRPASQLLGSGAREGTRSDGRERRAGTEGDRGRWARGPRRAPPAPGAARFRGAGGAAGGREARGRVTGLKNAPGGTRPPEGTTAGLSCTGSALGPGTRSSRARGRAEEVKHRCGARQSLGESWRLRERKKERRQGRAWLPQYLLRAQNVHPEVP